VLIPQMQLKVWSSVQVNINHTAKETVLLHVLLTKDVLLSPALQGPWAEVVIFVHAAYGVKWNLLVQALLDAASDSQ